MVRWILVVLVWLVPLASLFACPYDLHGVATCSAASQSGLSVSFYLVAPGLWLGSVISQFVVSDPYAGASPSAYAFGCAVWLVLLSTVILFAPRIYARVVKL